MKKNKILTLAFVGALMLTGFFGFTSDVLASESVMYPDSYENSDYANPERYTPNADDLSRFVYSDEMEAKESVVVQDYLYYMEDGEVVVEPISGVSIDYKGKVSYSYGGYTYSVGDFTVNGYQAYCLEHDASTPGDGTSNDGGNPYDDPEIQGALYYGWGGQGQIDFDSRNQGIVVTSLVLDELYTNQNNTGAISNCPQYKELESKARAGMPSSDFEFSDTTLTTTVSGGTQTSQTTKMNGDVENKVSFSIPSEVTFHNKTTGQTQKGGKVTIKGGDSFYFTAPSNYEPDYNSGSLKGTIRPVNPMVVKMDNSSLQDLGFAPYKDPVPQNGFTVQFKNYQHKITVNHIDQRTGEVITKETYTKNQGDNYTYYPKDDLKQDGIPYTPVSNAPVSGTVGTSDITINFYYTLPVVEVGLDSVKIPTAPASEGLDAYVRLILDDVYDSAMTDTVNPNFTLAIYEGTTKITSKEVSSSTFDDSQEVILEVPSSMLNVDEMNNYTVKIEGYDSKDVHVNAKEITIEGYTASEETIEVNASTTQQELAYEGVAGTYEKYGQAQQTAYESFSIPNITQLGKEKSGFGFELPISFYYNFDDSSGQFASQIEPPELTMNVPNEIVDTTYIEYETDGITSEVPFEKISETGSSIPYSEDQLAEIQKMQAVISSGTDSVTSGEDLATNNNVQDLAESSVKTQSHEEGTYDDYEEVTVYADSPIMGIQGFTVTDITDTTVTVTWDYHPLIEHIGVSVPGFAGYCMWLDGEHKGTVYGGTDTNTYTFTNLEPGTNYELSINGSIGFYHPIPGETVTVTTTSEEVTQPQPITGLEVINTTSDTITVGWDEYSGEEEFNVYLNDELYGTAEANATSYTIDYLEPNTTYTIGIEPVMPGGTVADMSEVTATTLSDEETQPITGLEVTEVTTNSITVRWDAYSGEEKFNVYVNDELYDEAGYGATSYTLEGLEQSTSYSIGIEPVMVDGTKAPMSKVTATTKAEEVEETPDLPQAPMSLSASATEYTIELSWTDGSYADSYNIYLNGTKKTNTTNNSYTFSGLTPNTTYTVGVSSVNEYGESEISKLTITTMTIPTNMSDSQIYQLPHVWCEDMSGELFTDEQVKNNDPRITDELIDGGNKFYTPIWCDLGKYPITVTNEDPIGANEVNIEINYILDVYAQMYGTVDSETIEDDHIIWRPVDVNNPFPEGKPENWTDEDVEWLTSNNFVW